MSDPLWLTDEQLKQLSVCIGGACSGRGERLGHIWRARDYRRAAQRFAQATKTEHIVEHSAKVCAILEERVA